MNNTILPDETLKELKDLAKKIEDIEIELTCFGNDDNLILRQRKLTEKITEIIKTL